MKLGGFLSKNKENALFSGIRAMRYLKIILIGIFAVAVAVQAAGGAAALVGQKSKTGGYTYSDVIQIRFLRDCSESANQVVCECVLTRLQGEYSEKEFTERDANLRKGYRDSEFTSFVSRAVEECDAEFAETAPALSEEQARAYVDSILKVRTKKEFIKECVPSFKEVHGSSGANKICGCVYAQLVRDTARIVQAVMDNSIMAENQLWALDFVLDCMPDKMTPEIKKFFIDRMNQMGLPKSMGQCIVNGIAQEYSMKTFLSSLLKNENTLESAFMMMGTKCALEKMQ